MYRSGDVVLGERTGFVRLAQASGVPIVPVVISGSHHAYLVLPGARRLAERLGLPRLMGVRSLPLTLGGAALVVVLAGSLLLPVLLPLAALAALQALIPWPTSITMTVLPPIRLAEGEDERAAAARVSAAMQAGMDHAHRRRPSLVSIGQRARRTAAWLAGVAARRAYAARR